MVVATRQLQEICCQSRGGRPRSRTRRVTSRQRKPRGALPDSARSTPAVWGLSTLHIYLSDILRITFLRRARLL